jgi:hypothetical protein
MKIPFDAVLKDLMKFASENGMEGSRLCPECRQIAVVFVKDVCSLCHLLRNTKAVQ